MRIADRWFERRRIGDSITFLTEPFAAPLVRCNIWHVRSRDRDLLVDSGLGVASLRSAARDLFERPLVAVATHYHYDHIGGLHEFETRLVHRLEADRLARPRGAALRTSNYPEAVRRLIVDSGYQLPEELLTAYPRPDFDPSLFATSPAAPTRLVEEGDVVDLGDRAFTVLHLPGHSPGSIGLWDARSGVLFSGDAIYDGPLIDFLPDSDRAAYVRTMQRLRELPVTVVHAGHDPSFGRQRLIELADSYLDRARARP